MAGELYHERGRLCCRGCQEEGILINLWEHPANNPSGSMLSNRGRVVGQVAHNTQVQITRRCWVAGEGRYYYYVYADTGQQGWVPNSFVEFGSGECRW